MPVEATVAINGHELELSSLGKVMYPADGFTKGEVIEYYRQIAPVLLPYLHDRPVTLIRYPDGIGKQFFYAKRCPPYRPDWMETLHVPTDSDKPLDYCLLNDEAALTYVANLAGLELHVMLYRKGQLERPDWIVFDCDPGPGKDLVDCCRLGLTLRDVLEEAGLASYPKSSGKKGLHIYVPLNTPEVTFEATKTFARAVAELLEQRMPTEVTSNMRKALRKGKIFIDWSQNDAHKTTVAPYSLRGDDRPTVSTPLTWAEVARAAKKGDATKLVLDPAAMVKRVTKLGDLFAGVLTEKQRLPGL